MLLRDRNRRFHFGELAGNNDLPGRINVRNIDILIVGQLADRVFVSANHRRHAARRRGASFVHELAALLHELQTIFKIEGAGCGVRGELA